MPLDDALAASANRSYDAQRAKPFVAAFQAGDARAVAAFWTPDGNYVDAAGKQTKGRAAIEKLYSGDTTGAGRS